MFCSSIFLGILKSMILLDGFPVSPMRHSEDSKYEDEDDNGNIDRVLKGLRVDRNARKKKNLSHCPAESPGLKFTTDTVRHFDSSGCTDLSWDDKV
jgi:hypothetical protein